MTRLIITIFTGLQEIPIEFKFEAKFTQLKLELEI